MAALTDSQIAELLSEPKPLPIELRKKLRLRKRKSRPGERGASIDVIRADGHTFRVFLKVNDSLPNNFSLGLVYFSPSGEKLKLIRCNGWHDAHRNVLEKTVIPADTPHIHRRTERYENAKRKEMGYAEVTGAYHDRKSALKYFFKHYGFYRPTIDRSGQRSLFS